MGQEVGVGGYVALLIYSLELYTYNDEDSKNKRGGRFCGEAGLVDGARAYSW